MIKSGASTCSLIMAHIPYFYLFLKKSYTVPRMKLEDSSSNNSSITTNMKVAAYNVPYLTSGTASDMAENTTKSCSQLTT